MASYGYRGDVTNSIGLASAYPGGRTFGTTPPAANRFRFRNNSAGELGAMNQGRYPMAAGAAAASAGADMLPPQTNGIMGKPSSWWVMFLVIFVAFVWVARKYGGGEKERFGNLLPSFYNGVFLTIYIVLILNVLKVFATKFKIPGVSELILAA